MERVAGGWPDMDSCAAVRVPLQGDDVVGTHWMRCWPRALGSQHLVDHWRVNAATAGRVCTRPYPATYLRSWSSWLTSRRPRFSQCRIVSWMTRPRLAMRPLAFGIPRPSVLRLQQPSKDSQ